uniref:AAA+ ATPase domain-containing protein n=1 Tax=Hanusia phi TaxID=3032 RepID=A0A7S0E9I4_9CRYP
MMSSPVEEAYQRLINSGEIKHDEGQLKLAHELGKLQSSLHTRHRTSKFVGHTLGKLLSSAMRMGGGYGIYIYGSVGVGKSLLMDLFFQTLQTERKRRVHFHSFMLEMHRKAHLLRQSGNYLRETPRLIGELLARETDVICFDEFQVTDVADAMILRIVFETLFRKNVFLIATSNRPPDDLYSHGINRDLFLPFIELVKKQCLVVDLSSGVNSIDYRLLHPSSFREQIWFCSRDVSAHDKLARVFQHLAGKALEDAGCVQLRLVMGRELTVAHAHRGVAIIDFNDVCARALGSADYLAIAENFHTIIIKDVPTLSLENHDQTRRFIMLIDELYEHRCRLIVSTLMAFNPIELFAQLRHATTQKEQEAADLERLRKAKEEAHHEDEEGMTEKLGFTIKKGHHMTAGLGDIIEVDELSALRDLIFAFSRCESRLCEMQTLPYQQVAHTHPKFEQDSYVSL